MLEKLGITQLNEMQIAAHEAIAADEVDEYGALALLLGEMGEGRGILFCSLKDTLNKVSVFLNRK